MSALAALLLLTGLAAMWRLLHGPHMADRLLSVQMLGTTSIGLLLVMAEWLSEDHWRDVALVLALLGAVISAALVQLLRPARKRENR
ncbi:MAG: monovalent cation/H+ antiporter complex subunit F [Pseudomonadota bacterium]